MSPVVADERLWDGLQEYVRQTMGNVGIFKMLGLRSEEEAGPLWLSRVRPMIETLSAVVPVSTVDTARLALPDGVSVQLTIHGCIISVENSPRWSTRMSSDPAAVTLAALGRQRWGDSWVGSLGSAPGRPVVTRTPGSFGIETYPWVAQNPGGPAPYTCAVSEEDARLSAVAEERGSVDVSELFVEFEGRSS